MQLSKNFNLDEFVSDEDPKRPGAKELANLKKLCELVLEPLRAILGGPVIVTSGYRSVEHNARVGGAPQSQHLLGIAADISVPGDLDDQVAIAKILFKNPAVGGIGLYSHKRIIHVDIRKRAEGGPAIWLHSPTGAKPIPDRILKQIRGEVK